MTLAVGEHRHMTIRASGGPARPARSVQGPARKRPAARRRPGSIRHVSDTARWVAMYRAAESERPDALFRDPHACRLAGERGAAILRALPFGEALGWTLVVRTRLVDDAVR